jgi:hypothetical protein
LEVQYKEIILTNKSERILSDHVPGHEDHPSLEWQE